jgi:hypothetical protein
LGPWEWHIESDTVTRALDVDLFRHLVSGLASFLEVLLPRGVARGDVGGAHG